MQRGLRNLIPTGLLLSAWLTVRADSPAALVDVFTEDVTRFTRLLDSPLAERRIEGIQGLSSLKHWPAEDALLQRLDDPSPAVQRETVLASGRLGTAKSVPRLIRLLDRPAWELRQNAWLGLCHITAQTFPADVPAQWSQWWNSGAATNLPGTLLAAATNSNTRIPRHDALRALPHLASPAFEDALIRLLSAPGLTAEERDFVAEALERVGTARAIPALASLHTDAAAWALGRIGGPEAEKALLVKPAKSLGVLLHLDRLHSTNCGWLVPYLVSQMGLVTFRGQPDDLMNHDAQPIQRVGANLIRRSGLAPLLIELALQELEDSMKPPTAHAPRPACPVAWNRELEAMREELKPGFVRDDGVTKSQPLTALYHVATDKALTQRLIPLLRHPAFVPRVYVAMTLGKLHATEAFPEILGIIREGYTFSDSTALASGKHFDQSQTVRWRGFLCMALGRMGGDDARQALESLAADSKQPRDIRYGSVVGLGFLGSPKSLPVLRQAATNDIIWMVRDEARRAAADIELLSREERR
jgi:HEAT repeat protein